MYVYIQKHKHIPIYEEYTTILSKYKLKIIICYVCKCVIIAIICSI